MSVSFPISNHCAQRVLHRPAALAHLGAHSKCKIWASSYRTEICILIISPGESVYTSKCKEHSFDKWQREYLSLIPLHIQHVFCTE